MMLDQDRIDRWDATVIYRAEDAPLKMHSLCRGQQRALLIGALAFV